MSCNNTVSNSANAAELVLRSTDGHERIVVFDASKDKLADILAFDSVIEFFCAENAQQVIDHLVEVNGNAVNDSNKSIFLTCLLSNGFSVTVDLESIDEDTEDQNAAAENCAEDTPAAAPSPLEGFVLVRTSGGLQETRVVIKIGETTIKDAIYNDNVRARSGMTDAQLSNCTVALNGVAVTDNLLAVKTLQNGDVLMLNVKGAHDKGAVIR
jgi:hypothetical protein